MIASPPGLRHRDITPDSDTGRSRSRFHGASRPGCRRVRKPAGAQDLVGVAAIRGDRADPLRPTWTG